MGQTLKIPNRVSNLNNDYETNKPYSASAIIGDLTPTLPDPPPVYPAPESSGGGDGCGGMGEILTIVVVVVVAYYLGPQVFEALGGTRSHQ